VNSAGLSIENAHWKLRLHPEGGFAAIENRASGKPLFESSKRSGVFTGNIDGKKEESRGQWHFPPEQEGLPRIVAVETGVVGTIPYRTELTIWADSPRLDARVRFDFDGQKIGAVTSEPRDSRSAFVHEEKLRFKTFPAVTASAVGVRDLPFIISETAEAYVNGIYWAAVSDGRTGLAVFNKGSMGAVREADGGFSIPLAFANSYIWGTRILSGEFVYEFSLWPFEGPWQEAGLHKHALEYNLPCVGFASEPGNGELGQKFQPIAFASTEVIVSAAYPQGGAFHLRLYEHTGHPAATNLRAWKDQRLTEVNLAGESLAPLQNPVAFRPWQIRTLRLG
jgi:hypothetical protein